MKLKLVYKKAKEVGVKNTHKMNKTSLIRSIQSTEGNAACYQTKNECDQKECLWRKDCIDNLNTRLKRFKFWMK